MLPCQWLCSETLDVSRMGAWPAGLSWQAEPSRALVWLGWCYCTAQAAGHLQRLHGIMLVPPLPAPPPPAPTCATIVRSSSACLSGSARLSSAACTSLSDCRSASAATALS
jgi:hypothetical protein